MISVVIIDDSFMARTLFQKELGADPEILVSGVVGDAAAARDLVLRQSPDAVVIDPCLVDGQALLRWLCLRGTRRVVALIGDGPDALDRRSKAAELGAEALLKGHSALDAATLVDSIREVLLSGERSATRDRTAAPLRARNVPEPRVDRVIAIGASTGGTEALATIIQRLPAGMPPVLVVQHMPAGFTAALAERLDRGSVVAVSEAVDGEPLRRGHVYISPGDRHMGLGRQGDRLRIRLGDGPTVNRHKPAVDLLFMSAAKHLGRRGVGVILTGMGADGARGLKAMHDAGAVTIAQDEASCVVFGMPREAIALGAADRILPLDDVAPALVEIAGIRPAALI